MTEPDFADDLDCGFFDQMEDLLDFPNEGVDAGLSAADCAAFPSIWTDQSESLAGSDSLFSNNSNSDLSAEISIPYDVQLEWLSTIVDDSAPGESLTINNNEDSFRHQFQSSSPVSVLESSSSCLVEKAENETAAGSPETAATGKRGRARSKRPRPAAFNPRPIQLTSPSSSVTENDPAANYMLPPKVPSDSENYAESRLLIKIPRQFNQEHKKKKKMKRSNPSAPIFGDGNENPPAQAVRKCMHCEITKTPQWRAGPMGPKTLCNACGVRYKSGRLFPEYRPAASPTFVPSIHSNSHKKVLEMRTKNCTATALLENSPELIPNNTNPAMDYI